MKHLQRLRWMAVGLFTLVVIGIATAPKVRAAIKAVFVEVVLPSQPFSGGMLLRAGIPAEAIGPDSGTLGVSSLTITNLSPSQKEVLIGIPLISGGSCSAGTLVGVLGNGLFRILVQPTETIHMTFPSPLVINNSFGHTCITASVANATPDTGVEIFVNGFVN